jgi:tetratricopeptide (TPR) repeat protein
MGKYDEAIHCYEHAFNQEDTIVSLSRILACTIEAGRYDQAEKYIHLANQR